MNLDTVKSFERFPISKVPSAPGIYFLFDAGEVVYVGHSQSSIRARVFSHRDKAFDSVAVYFTDEDLRDVEGEAIVLCQPKYNQISSGKRWLNTETISWYTGIPFDEVWPYAKKHGFARGFVCGRYLYRLTDFGYVGVQQDLNNI